MQLAARTGAWSGKRLPYLRRVAYLESHGDAYIDMGIHGTNGMAAEMEIQFYEFRTSGYGGSIFGDRESGNYRAFAIGTNSWNINPNSDYFYGHYDNVNVTNLNVTKVNLNKFVLVINASGLFVNGTMERRFGGETPFTTPRTLKMFASYDAVSGAGFGVARCRFMYCKIFKNGVLIQDFIPVLDLSGRPAMYDEVSGQLFYNQGTGEFTWGELET